MARISRKTDINALIETVAEKPLFNTGIYARLSMEDKEMQSLDNQILMIENYIGRKPDLKLVNTFQDNGRTGTNFNRPGFEALMENIKCGKINCIVVKDLSRFGRNYIEAGNLLEVIFPRLGIRFISMGDNYDSFDPSCQGDGMSIALKNMINAFYSKDISVKISSALKVKREKGDYTGAAPPLGYIKSPDNKDKLIIDEEGANIIRLIFKLKLDGMNVNKISRYLTKENIPNPGYYRYKNGIQKKVQYKKSIAWDYSILKKILKNPVYIGHLVSGKTRMENGVSKAVPKEEWVKVEHTHEGIISLDDFEKVNAEMFQVEQKRRENNLVPKKRPPVPENLFKGMIFCSDCGRFYTRIFHISKEGDRINPQYICKHCKRVNPKGTYKYFKQQNLYDCIFQAIKIHIDICAKATRIKAKFNAKGALTIRQAEIEKKISNQKAKIQILSVKKLKLHSDLCENSVSIDEYKLISKNYDTEVTQFTNNIEILTTEMEKQRTTEISENRCMTTYQRFLKDKELSREMLLALVEKIEVGGDLGVNIHFRFKDEFEKLEEFIKESEVDQYAKC